MNASNDINCIINWKLATVIGLRTILNPKTIKIRGRNVFQIFLVFGFVLPAIIISSSLICGIYRWKSDINNVALYAGYSAHTLFSCYLIMSVFYNSSKLWEYFNSLSGLNFGMYPHYKKNIFKKWRVRSTRLSLALVILYICSSIVWILISSVLYSNNYVVKLKNGEDSWDVYQFNILNFYFFVSDRTYNKLYNIFYSLELIVSFEYTIALVLFDFIVITMCVMFCCQLERISDAIQSLGEKVISKNSIKSKYTDNTVYVLVIF